mmetsp:Transcript_972/g.1501  ORF Transcript_972/g.1501 Transcript_972/m.1501 type:complete len:421 (+) Transcript_972:181-1443(+)
MSQQKAVIVSFARTPIARFRGSFSSLKAPQLGSTAIKGALSRIKSNGNGNGAGDIIEDPQNYIYEAFMGNVVSAGIGQAPCRQAVIGAGLPQSTICTTINKVCASGMKSVMLASQMIQCNGLLPTSNTKNKHKKMILAGGMESMSNIPHYLPSSRTGTNLGHAQLLDGVIYDGLWDIYNNQHMGMCAEKCARDYGISRAEQDEYALESYRRSQDAIESGVFDDEIEIVEIKQRRKESIIVKHDEEPAAVNIDRVPSLRPAFTADNGTVTAANASSLNDGAAALVLMGENDAKDMGLVPLARILAYGDAEQDPVDFTTAPSHAVPVALENAGVELADVEYHEINEAFSVVALANMKLLNLDPARVNIFGGAVSLGHPIGMSGARIIGTLYNALKRKDATLGCASICNGGGGASAIVLERMN